MLFSLFDNWLYLNCCLEHSIPRYDKMAHCSSDDMDWDDVDDPIEECSSTLARLSISGQQCPTLHAAHKKDRKITQKARLSRLPGNIEDIGRRGWSKRKLALLSIIPEEPEPIDLQEEENTECQRTLKAEKSKLRRGGVIHNGCRTAASSYLSYWCEDSIPVATWRRRGFKKKQSSGYGLFESPSLGSFHVSQAVSRCRCQCCDWLKSPVTHDRMNHSTLRRSSLLFQRRRICARTNTSTKIN
ncbi:uncharacterized protein LOC141761967 isoform X2 [Sebastes fasciatus]|uniref:uncharacterized protein LOC141761967 isoform X2 n=1 Tax=Sebastes fasciatus TaxID=394691 RepID=UPI003D9E781D